MRSPRAVAHLIVVLKATDKSVSREIGSRTTMAASAIGRVTAVVGEPLRQDLGQVGQRSEVMVVAVPLAREHRMQSVVKVFVPLGIDPVASLFA